MREEGRRKQGRNGGREGVYSSFIAHINMLPSPAWFAISAACCLLCSIPTSPQEQSQPLTLPLLIVDPYSIGVISCFFKPFTQNFLPLTLPETWTFSHNLCTDRPSFHISEKKVEFSSPWPHSSFQNHSWSFSLRNSSEGCAIHFIHSCHPVPIWVMATWQPKGILWWALAPGSGCLSSSSLPATWGLRLFQYSRLCSSI